MNNSTSNHETAFIESNRIRLKKKKWHRNFTTIVIGVFDILLINLAVILGYYLRFYVELGVEKGWIDRVPVASISGYLKALVFIDYVLIILFNLFHLYRRDRSRWYIDEIYNIFKSLSLGFIIITSLTFFARTEDFQFSRTVCFYAYFLSILFISIWRYVILRVERLNHLKEGNISRVLIIGSEEMARMVVKRLCDRMDLGYRIAGFITPEIQNLRDLEGFPYLGSLENFELTLDKYQIDEIFVSESKIGHFKLLEMASACESMGVNVKMVPTVYDLLIDFADMSDLDGLPLVAVREQPMYQLSLFTKRIFDIAFSIMILALSAPISIILAVLVRIDSPGGIFFTQIRAGVGGKPFKMHKFRTMYYDSEAKLNELVNFDELKEPVFKIKNDPRITRIGKFLRRTSLDEIPQFWNVLKGEMSVVGPRPEETQLVDKYNIWQRRRLNMKPGITGMQQIICRGTTSLEDRVKYDIYYLRKHSLLLDIYIILKTIPVVLSGEGAF